MSKLLQLPDIPEAAQTPLVKELLGIIAQLAEKVRQHEETIAQLRDEIAVLKGEKKRPQFKPSQLDNWTLDKPNPFRFEKAVIPDEPERISERLKPPFSGETGV